MEHNSTETGTPDGRDAEELTVESLCQHLQQNPHSTNSQLFSLLVLLNAYVPESYLRMCECQRILGPPDPIHGCPPFEDRMRPFTPFINTSSPDEIRVISPKDAQMFVNRLPTLGITRSTMVKKFMSLLGGNPPESYIQFIRDLLLKREMRGNGKEKFSALIRDINEEESFDNAVSVLKTASDTFEQDPIYPQTVSRLYYIIGKDYNSAEEWAIEAISRAPNNSYTADTLGQIYKHRLRIAEQRSDVKKMAQMAFQAFEDEDKKANREGPQMEDVGAVRITKSFNNRGLFGFIQVAKIAFEKLKGIFPPLHPNLKMNVKAKFDFFEWFLTYSKIDLTTSEPDYFWKDVALCYKNYTAKTAADSTSFPGLLSWLSHGLFTSKERRAELLVSEKTVSDFENIRDVLRTDCEKNADDVKVAERYILSNILLSNKRPDPPQLVTELQAILHRFLGTDAERQRPEFCLLVLLLFWPEEQLQVPQEEDENIPQGESAQQSPEIMPDPDLGEYVTLMERAFERAKYAKYLRGRYLLTLFFLGNGSGLSRWIHKSRLDAAVEEKVDQELAEKVDLELAEKVDLELAEKVDLELAEKVDLELAEKVDLELAEKVDQELADKQHEKNKKKEKRINDIWRSGEVWHIPQIRDILLPVRVEPCQYSTMPKEHEEQEVFVCAGEKRIKARVEAEPHGSGRSPMLYYLGFTIQGPVVFKVDAPDKGQ